MLRDSRHWLAPDRGRHHFAYRSFHRSMDRPARRCYGPGGRCCRALFSVPAPFFTWVPLSSSSMPSTSSSCSTPNIPSLNGSSGILVGVALIWIARRLRASPRPVAGAHPKLDAGFGWLAVGKNLRTNLASMGIFSSSTHGSGVLQVDFGTSVRLDGHLKRFRNILEEGPAHMFGFGRIHVASI